MTENELASFVGTVKPIGLTILFVLANLVRPPRIADLARIISMNAKTLSPEMDRLALLGYVQALPAGRHPRWVLTDKAKQLPLFALSELTGMLLAGQPVRAEARSGMLLAEQPSPGEEPEPEAERNFSPVSPPKVRNEQRNSPLTAAVVVDQISDLDLDLDQDQDQQQQQQAAVSREILRSERRTAILSACIELGIGYPTNRRLADDEWVTADRLYRAARQCKLEGRWENPIGQAITRLEDHLEPKTTAELEARISDQRFATVTVAVAEEHGAKETSPGISVDMPRLPAPDPDREAQQTWQAALGELQLQMTKPTFAAYIKPAILVAHDPDFVLAVENTFLRDWLETKLLHSIQRALAGITNRTVTVRIITWSEAS